ncbi:MAG: hypothetical protein K0V04_34450 [Deltaproteobacteria bacterium]|nr:hypothetical protein [Deltaproteobacteria bacterium]
MPALERPVSEFVHQFAIADEGGLPGFDRLVATLMCCTAGRCGLPTTARLESLSYFSAPPTGAMLL